MPVVDARGGPPRCSVIVPVYNRASLTRQCLRALIEQPVAVDVEIVVVDDASRDETARLLAGHGERLRVVTHATNRGFSAACNDGAAVAAGAYLVFLNNDILPRPGWLDALVAYADEHPGAAMVGGKLLFPDDTIQHVGVAIAQDRYPRHLYAGFPHDHPAVNRSRRVQIVTAACALVRRAVFEQLGGFDPAYMNGYEDVDLCLRLNERGHEVHYCHGSTLVHFESVSAGRFDHLDRNTRLYFSRWGERVRPDDVQYYLDDGLLGLSYADTYPARLIVSPLLATIERDEAEVTLDTILDQRARQVGDLLKETIRLHVDLREAEDRLRAAENDARAVAPPAGGAADSTGSTTPAVPSPPASSPPAPRLVAAGTVHTLTGPVDAPLISILLPVKNGAERLRELLPAIRRQRCAARVEIIAVDSGSEDDSLAVLREHGARVLAIDARDFNHGLTRGLAAAAARGQLLVFVNQGTLPADDVWLANLIAPFEHDPRLAGVCSRVLPRPDADPLARQDGLRDASAADQRRVREITDWAAYRGLSHHELRLFINFHTVSAAIRPQALSRVPFHAVTIGEDILWAKQALEAGFRLQHEPSSVVYHSHRYTPLDILRRNVDDGRANREIVGRRLPDDEVIPLIAELVRDDWRYLERECRLGPPDLEQWRLTAALRRTAQIAGQWLGVNHDRLPDDLIALLSLTEQIKSHAPHPRTMPADGRPSAPQPPPTSLTSSRA